jgi:hypothetical protein
VENIAGSARNGLLPRDLSMPSSVGETERGHATVCWRSSQHARGETNTIRIFESEIGWNLGNFWCFLMILTRFGFGLRDKIHVLRIFNTIHQLFLLTCAEEGL